MASVEALGKTVKDSRVTGNLGNLEMENVELGKLGDLIAQTQGYVGLTGMDAVHRYLVDKYHWQPSQVRGMSETDLCLLLAGYVEQPSTFWD